MTNLCRAALLACAATCLLPQRPCAAADVRVTLNDDHGQPVAGGIVRAVRRQPMLDLPLDLRDRAALTLPDMALVEGPTVLVQFLDAETGAPVPRPKLQPESLEASGFSLKDIVAPDAVFVGDDEGRVALRGLRVGLHRFVLAMPSLARYRLPDIEVTADTTAIDLGVVTVGAGTTARFSVRDADDTPAAGLAVRLDYGPGVSPLRPLRETTDAEGVAEIPHLGPGRYRVRIGGDERPGGVVPVAQRWFDVRSADVTVAHTIVISGALLELSVMTDSGPVVGAEVRAAAGEDDVDAATRGIVVQTPDRMINAPFRRASRGITDTAGYVALERSPVGQLRVSVLRGPTTWTTTATLAAEGARETLVIPERSTMCTVLDSFTSMPVNARGRWTARTGVRVETRADTAGRLELTGLPEGGGQLTISADGYESQKHQVDTPDAIPSTVSLTPVRSTLLRVRITDEQSVPLADATVGATDLADPSARRFGQTGLDGTTLLSLAGPGALRIHASRFGFAAAVVSPVEAARGASNAVTIRLREGYRVHIGVGELGDESAALQLQVRDGTGYSLPTTSFDDASTMTYPSGCEGSVGLLAPGRYVLRFSGDRLLYERRVVVADRDVFLRVP